MTSGDQFRPAPPPAPGSPEFQTDLAEIRLLSDTRTPEQLAIAQFWAPKAATYMNEVGAGMIVAHKVKEREAAHILALANMAAFDAHIGCWDAKLTYWFFRPYQADPSDHHSNREAHSLVVHQRALLQHFLLCRRVRARLPHETALLQGYTERGGALANVRGDSLPVRHHGRSRDRRECGRVGHRA